MIEEEVTTLYCANHPNTETTLRCNRCEKPICTRCAVLTPTGYRCKDCVRGQQKLFSTAQWYDYLLAAVVAGLLSFIGSLMVQFLGFFSIFLAPVAGVIIAEAVRLVIRRRRSKLLFQTAAAAAFAGSLPFILLYLFGFGRGNLISLLFQGYYTFVVASTIYYRLGGISIR